MSAINREDWVFPGESQISVNSKSQRSLCKFLAIKKKPERKIANKGEITMRKCGLVKNVQYSPLAG